MPAPSIQPRRSVERHLVPVVVMVMVLVFHPGPDSSHRLNAQDLDFTAVPKLTCGITNQGAVGAINSAGLLSAITVTNFLNGMSLSTVGEDTGRTPLLRASDVTVGDFNGDGCQDIAQIDRMAPAGGLQVLSGYGDGTFGFWRHYPLTSGAILIDTINADGDGIDDLVIGEPGGVQIFSATYMLGGAPGPTRVELPYTPSVVATNDDLGPGAAISLAIGGKMANGTFRINGLKTGAATITSPIVTGITTQIDVADTVIEDIEIVPPSESLPGPVGVTANYTATGLFTAGPSGVTAYDITNVATWSTSNPTVATVTNAGPGRGVITTPATSVEVEDVNDDGLNDIVILTDDNQVQVLTATRTPIAATSDRPAGVTTQYTATGRFSDGTTLDITRAVSWQVDDFNADGNVDILLGGAQGQNGVTRVIRLQGEGTGQFKVAGEFNVTGVLSDGNTIDLNGDGLLEFISTGSNGLVITETRPGGISIRAPVFNGVTGLIDQDNSRRFFLDSDVVSPDMLKAFTDAQISETFGVDRDTITSMAGPGAVYMNHLTDFTKSNPPPATITISTPLRQWTPLTSEQRTAIRDIVRSYAPTTGAGNTPAATDGRAEFANDRVTFVLGNTTIATVSNAASTVGIVDVNTAVSTAGNVITAPSPTGVVEPDPTGNAPTAGPTDMPLTTTIINRSGLQSSSDPFDRAVYEGGTKPSSSSGPLRRSTYADGHVTYTDTQSGTTYTVTPNRDGTFDVSYNGASMRVDMRQGGLETAARLLVDPPAPPVGTTGASATTTGTPQPESTPLTPEQRAAIREIMRPFAATATTGSTDVDPQVRAYLTELFTGTTGSLTGSNVDSTGSSSTAKPVPLSETQRGLFKLNPKLLNNCSGETCAPLWKECTESNDCPRIEKDCGFPGVCSSDVATRFGGPAASDFNVLDSSAWNTSNNAEVETRIQIKIGDVVFDVVIRSVQSAAIGSWFNPLGLLSRHLRDNIERWHGSVGPRPLMRPRDLELVEKHSGSQAAGLPKGVHVLLSDRGGSTGKTLAMQVLNLSGQPVRLSSLPFVIEPIKQQVQQRVQQAFTRLVKASPINVDLAGYCLEFMKLPPSANQIYRLAPAAVQKKYEAMSRVLRSAYRVEQAGALRPDSNPAAYTDSIKQWAIWAVEQKFDETRFTEAFLGHTKKNVEAAGQQWSRPAEDMVRKVSPNRWRDILKVLQGAGLPVPQ